MVQGVTHIQRTLLDILKDEGKINFNIMEKRLSLNKEILKSNLIDLRSRDFVGISRGNIEKSKIKIKKEGKKYIDEF